MFKSLAIILLSIPVVGTLRITHCDTLRFQLFWLDDYWPHDDEAGKLPSLIGAFVKTTNQINKQSVIIAVEV